MTKDSKSEGSCCKDSSEGKMVKATELPIHGNPYPPKDVVIDESPNALKLKISSIRSSLTPYTSPLVSVIGRTSDVMAIGSSHLQTTLQGLVESQNSFRNAAIITTAGIVGTGLARRHGIIKKFLYGTTFIVGSTALLYPKEVGQKAQLFWYIAKNKVPDFVQLQYQKYFNAEKPIEQKSESGDPEK